MKECTKVCVKKCKRAKNWKIDFIVVCIFFLDGSHICSFLPIFALLQRPGRINVCYPSSNNTH